MSTSLIMQEGTYFPLNTAQPYSTLDIADKIWRLYAEPDENAWMITVNMKKLPFVIVEKNPKDYFTTEDRVAYFGVLLQNPDGWERVPKDYCENIKGTDFLIGYGGKKPETFDEMRLKEAVDKVREELNGDVS